MSQYEMNSPEKPLILLVDDHEDNRTALGMVLERAGYRVEEAGDGEAALRKNASLRPDLMILDLAMPKLDGKSVLKQLRSTGDMTLVLIMSAMILSLDRPALYAMGATEVLTKPVMPPQFLDIVGTLLAERGTPAALARSFRQFSEYAQQQESRISEIRMDLARVAKKRARWRVKVKECTEQKRISGTSTLIHMPRGGLLDRSPPASLAGPPSLTDNGTLGPLLRSTLHSLSGDLASLGACLSIIKSDPAIIDEMVELASRSLAFCHMQVSMLREVITSGNTSREEFDLLSAVHEAATLARPRLPEGVDVVVEPLDEGFPWVVSANRLQILSVIIELLQNAGAAMENHPGKIRLRTENRDGCFVVEVLDEGPGFDVRTLEAILSHPIPRRGGLGFGLLLSKSIVERFGGRIEIDNRQLGAGVRLLLPHHNQSEGET